MADIGYQAMGRLHGAALGWLHAAALGLRRSPAQGTVEYVALILLVAVVLAGVVAATRKSSIGDGGIARTIVAKLKDALDSVK